MTGLLKLSLAHSIAALEKTNQRSAQMQRVKNKLFNGALIVALLVATFGWLCGLGWAAFKLFSFL
jgi:hypothetical protein